MGSLKANEYVTLGSKNCEGNPWVYQRLNECVELGLGNLTKRKQTNLKMKYLRDEGKSSLGMPHV